MSSANHHWYEREFKIRFLETRANSFQDFFSDVMEKAYPADFQRIRPHGKAGDLKCDGYLASNKTVFQVYAPDDLRRLDRLLEKIETDFKGARTDWGGQMAKWVFVYNTVSGLPALAQQKITDLKRQAPGIDISTCGYEGLRREFLRIDDAGLRDLFAGSSTFDEAQPNAPLVGITGEQRLRYWSWLRTASLDSSLHAERPKRGTLTKLGFPLRLLLDDPRNETTPRRPRQQVPRVKRIGTIELRTYLPGSSPLLIFGGSGAGKSTLARLYAKQLAGRLVGCNPEKPSFRTPIIIELCDFSGSRPLLNLVLASINRSGAAASDAQIKASLEYGEFTLLLDGLDEVDPELRSECIAQIRNLASIYARCHYIVTSRLHPEVPFAWRAARVAPLDDDDIAIALASRLGSAKAFKARVGCSPTSYLAALPNSLRELCRRPLTLSLVVEDLHHGNLQLGSIFDIFDRCVSRLLTWDTGKGREISTTAKRRVLCEAAHAMTEADKTATRRDRLLETTSAVLLDLRKRHIVDQITAERIINELLEIGILRCSSDNIRFAHQSFQDFFAAKHLIDSVDLTKYEAKIRIGVASFLFESAPNPGAILRAAILAHRDLNIIRPLLAEAKRLGKLDDDVIKLHEIVQMASSFEDMRAQHIDRTYPDDDEGLEWLNEAVAFCAKLGTPAIPLLKDLARAIALDMTWAEQDSGFEAVVEALEVLRWPGAALHRQLIRSVSFGDFLGPDFESCYFEPCNALEEYLTALDTDDLLAATGHLAEVEARLAEVDNADEEDHVAK